MEREQVLEREYDLGRSHLRVFDKEKKRFVIDFAEYKEISLSAPIRKDIKDPYTDFTIESAPRESVTKKRFVKGQAMSFSKELVTLIDNQDLKSDQDGTYVNFAYSTAREILDAKYDLKAFTVVKPGICIPTAEFYSENGSDLKGELEGDWIIKFNVTDEIVKFKIDSTGDVVLGPEGAIALTPAYEGDQADLIDESIGIIADMGQGSNDITVVKLGEAQGWNARSFPYGGISLESAVASQLERDAKGSSTGIVKHAIENGYIMDGTVKVPVGPLVSACKGKLANKTKESIISVLAEDFMQSSEIKYIFPIGRNFKTTDSKEETGYDTGDLALMLKEIWGSKIEIVKLDPLPDDYKCIDRTKPMKNGSYPEVPADIEELANVYGLGFTILSSREDEEDIDEGDESVDEQELHLA